MSEIEQTVEEEMFDGIWKDQFVEENGNWKESRKLYTLALVLKGVCEFYIDIYE